MVSKEQDSLAEAKKYLLKLINYSEPIVGVPESKAPFVGASKKLLRRRNGLHSNPSKK